MTFDDIENLISLFFTIIGLLMCLFKYITNSKHRYLYLIAFFILRFLSDYYWMVYQLVMGDTPSVYNYVSNLGWDIGYAVLLFTVIRYHKSKGERFFNPLILWPVLTNIPQLIIYLPYDSLWINLWEVGITTLIMIFCMKDIVWYVRNKKNGAAVPHFAVNVLVTHIFEYGMWTSSCFDWRSELWSPYFYLNIVASVSVIFYSWAMGADDESDEITSNKAYEMEQRARASIQAILSLVIFGGCFAGYFITKNIRSSMPDIEDVESYSGELVVVLFGISLLLVALVLVLLFVFSRRYKIRRNRRSETDSVKNSRNNLIFTILVVFLLMTIVLLYNTRALYNASVTEVYEDGEDKIRMTATDLDNYLTVAETTLRFAADTVDLMEKNGDSNQDIYKYLLEQTRKQSEQFDENFTGIYAYVNGEYMDGSGWIPPDEYDPESRDWYYAALSNPGKVVIVSPYVDAQTGYVVVTFAKDITDSDNEKGNHNVVCLDLIVNYINEVIEKTDIDGKGYGMVVNNDGFIVSHHDSDYNGKYVSEVYEHDLMPEIIKTGDGSFYTTIDDENYTLFVRPIMDQWYSVIVINDDELFEKVNSQMAANILVSLVLFFFIAYFYYLGYKSERNGAQKIEDLNMRIVTALASAIDAKDRYTSGHSQRVADYSVMIARQMGKTKEDIDVIYSAGLLHDVGKIRVPEDIINKPGRLTKEELDSIRIHPVSGYDILYGIHEDARIGYGAKYHHERYDGSGYPNCLEGEDIPEVARIIAVADSYDAMASDRSYRKALPQEVIREEIEKGRGSQFDPKIADIMLSIIDNDKNYELKQREKKTDNILVIDDEQMIIMHVKHIFEDMQDINVLSATNEDEAFSALGKTEISLILLDLKMPDIDGFDLYSKIRKTYDMPVILMTGDKSMETLQRIHELSIDDYVTKPLNGAITKEAVYGLLHRTDMKSSHMDWGRS